MLQQLQGAPPRGDEGEEVGLVVRPVAHAEGEGIEQFDDFLRKVELLQIG